MVCQYNQCQCRQCLVISHWSYKVLFHLFFVRNLIYYLEMWVYHLIQLLSRHCSLGPHSYLEFCSCYSSAWLWFLDGRGTKTTGFCYLLYSSWKKLCHLLFMFNKPLPLKYWYMQPYIYNYVDDYHETKNKGSTQKNSPFYKDPVYALCNIIPHNFVCDSRLQTVPFSWY